MEKDFITPPNHINFLAKQVFGSYGEIENVAVAHLQPNGGGPTTQHSHPHGHLFVVTKGEAKVLLGNDEHIIHENESFLIEGGRMHSVWNNSVSETVMIGITIKA